MRLLLIAALAMPIAAAAQPVPHGGGPGMGRGGGGKRPATFISPIGKPYRSMPGEPYAIVKWFNAIDFNHDGYVTADEFVREGESFFVELDVDKDGEITPDEIGRYEQQIAPEVQSGVEGFGGMGGGGRGMRHGGGRRGGGGAGGHRGEGMPDDAAGEPEGGSRAGGGRPMGNMPKGAAMYGLLGLPEPLVAADTNFNRGVSLDEMRAAARRRFAELDTTNKGRLRLDDLPQTPIERSMGLKRQ